MLNESPMKPVKIYVLDENQNQFGPAQFGSSAEMSF